MLQAKNPWQIALIEAVTQPKELLELLELEEHFLEAAIASSKLFPLKVPRGFIERMQKKNRFDPLLLQVLPVDLEQHTQEGYSIDPLQEKKYNPVPGLLHKYKSRVLLTPTGACGVHCRYCFRRHFAYTDNNPVQQGWSQVLDYIQQDATIHEVILSGGDPLVLSDHLLSEFTKKLTRIPHIKRLRLHTRMPIVIPERVTDELVHWIASLTLKTTVVIHCNHANEINQDVKDALTKLAKSGAILLNQSVLLKGVNDDCQTLCNLSEALIAAGVIPYYLHLLDKVDGAAHFDLAWEKAKAIHQEMTASLSGYLVPRLVKEVAGEGAKVRMGGV